MLETLGIVCGRDGVDYDEKFSSWDKDNSGSLCVKEFTSMCKSELGETLPVVFKFMQNKDQFDREISSRKNNELSDDYVVGILESYDAASNLVFAEEIKNVETELNSYPHALIMPAANRSLDAIFRSERSDNTQVITQMKQVLAAVKHLHEKNLSHGDLKKLNVVRVQEKLCLIDLDATSSLDGGYACAKFSSGILPPECFYELRSKDEVKMYTAYWKEAAEQDPELWDKIKPKASSDGRLFVVKCFLENIGADYQNLDLPYALLPASPALDIWALGLLLYNLVSGESLFPTNRDDDCTNGDVMRDLTDLVKPLSIIGDESAKLWTNTNLSEEEAKNISVASKQSDEEDRVDSKESKGERDIRTKILSNQNIKDSKLKNLLLQVSENYWHRE